MILVTGDTHGKDRWKQKYLPINQLRKEDFVVVCGDFGYLFCGTRAEEKYLDKLEKLNFSILFVDGNHESFPLIFSYPEEIWNGGRIHRIRKNIIHLMRGQVFEINGKRIFTMGGGYSIDIAFRKEGVSWWPEEMPSHEEYEEARVNLEKAGYVVDYIITHAAPEETMSIFHAQHDEERELNIFLEWVREHVKYKHWYFGHLHQDCDLWRHQTVIWFGVRNIENNEIIVL